ncbi:retrovirus-related pol polyprotein from transposon TNT 1-94, partial [Tanacetum coccineum]
AFVGGSWSDRGEEDDEKIQDETCLIAQAPNEIITKNKRLKATRNSLEKELRELKDKLSTLEKNKAVDLECTICQSLKIENRKLKEEDLKLTKFERSIHCLNEMINNQKPSGDKLGLGFNSFEASSSGTKEIKFMKAQKKAFYDGGPINMGGPYNEQAALKIIMGPLTATHRSEKSVSFQKSILGPRPKHIMVNNVKVLVASDNVVKQFYKPLSKPEVGFSKPNFRSKTPPTRRVNNNYSRAKTPQPKRNVGRQNQPHGFPCRVTFSQHDSEITKDDKVIGRGIRKKGLYVMKLGNKPKDKICLETIDENSTLWHRRLGHANMRLIQSLASKELVRNLPKLKFDQHFCDASKIGKQAHASHKAKNIVSMTRCLELLHMDLFGPSAIRSYGGNRYTLVIVDDYSRYTWTRFLKDKTEAFDQFEIFSKKIQNQLGRTIVSIRTDHGREFNNEVQFGEFCNANGITHNFSASRTPQSNGVVERKNRTLQEMSRIMLNEQSLPQKFWCNAVDTSTYILNRILIRVILGKTPYELLRGRKPTLDYFRVFGNKCFILNTNDYLTKFDPKSYEGVFLGYSQNSKAYIILNKHTRKIEESLNVTFDETSPPSKTSPLVNDDLDEEEAIKVTEKKNLENDIEDETLKIDEIVNIKESKNHPLENVIGNLNQRTLRSQAQNQSNFFCFISTIEPKNVNEALADESWIVAMQEELNQFIANDVWKLAPQPRNMTIIETELVAQGYNQQEGIDYDETYAPVARLESIRILLAYACALDFKLFQMDVKSAFLNGLINEEGAVCLHVDGTLDELAYGVPSDGPYQTNPPSSDDIILSIRIDREGQVHHIHHEEEIDVQEYQVLTREIEPTLKHLEEIILENVFCMGERKQKRDYGTRRGRHSTSSSTFNQPSSSHHNDDDDDGNNEGTSHASTPSPICYVNSLTNEVPQKSFLSIIPPRQLFVNISSDEDVNTTPSPKTTSSSPTPLNAPSKTTSTNQTSSSQESTFTSFQSKLHISPPSSNEPTSPHPLNHLLDNISDVPPRPLNPQPLQSHPSLDITLSLSLITPLDHIYDTPSPPSPPSLPQPQPPIMGHPLCSTTRIRSNCFMLFS